MRFIGSKTVGGPAWIGHFGPITSVEWSPDGCFIASGSYDGRVIVWNSTKALPFQILTHTRLVNGVRWSNDGRFLAVACGDGHCHIWRLEDLKHIVLSRHTDDVNTMAWSPDGTILATVSEDGTGRLWDTSSGSLADAGLMSHASHCMSVDFHPAGELIATCGEDATIRLWNKLGELVAAWNQPGDLEMVRWNQNGDLLAAACDDSTVRVFDKTGQLMTALGPHGGAVKSVTWAPNSEIIASGAYDLSISIWHVKTGRLLARVSDAGIWPRGLHCCPKTNSLVTGSQSGVPICFDLSTERADQAPAIKIRQPPVLRTCGVNAVSTLNSRCFAALDDATIRVESEHEPPRVISPVFARGSSLINTLDVNSQGAIAFGTFAGDVGIVLGEKTVALQTIGAPINCVRWNCVNLLAVADYAGRITILRFDKDFALFSQFKPHEAAIKSVDWFNNESLITGATDATLSAVDLKGRIQMRFFGHGNLVNCVAVAKATARPLIASASRDRTVRVWDSTTGECVRVLIGHAESVKSVCWRCGSNTQLASGSYDFDVRAWNIEYAEDDSRYSQALSFHEQGVSALYWGEAALYSGSWDGSLAKWVMDPGTDSMKLDKKIVFGTLGE